MSATTHAPVVAGSPGRLIMQVVRKAGPNVFVATVVPWGLFLLGHYWWGLIGGVLLALAGSTISQIIRVLCRQRLSALLILSSTELVVRSVLAVALKSPSTYFLAPAAATAVIGAVCIACAFRSTRLLPRIISELVPISVLESAPRASRLVRLVAFAYGAEQIFVAAASVVMFMNVTVTTYAALHPVVSWSILALAVVAFAPFLRKELAYGQLDVLPATGTAT